jgi:SpoIID/LytB domain protein
MPASYGKILDCFAQDSELADIDRTRILMSIRLLTSTVVPCLAVVAGVGGLPLVANAATSDVVVVGHGWGHGRGMGQYGAYGYAVDQGWSSAQILSHFYGGTKAGSIGNPDITVRLSSLEGPTDPLKSAGSWITSSQDFTVGNLLVAKGSAARIVRSGTAWKVFTTFHGCAAGNNFGPWIVTTASVTIAANPGDDTTKMLKVCANGRSYRGTLNPVPNGSSDYLVNTLPMDSYLRGVVPRESPASWGDAGGGRGMAALQAQAVAARSYAQAENAYPPDAKICDTSSCQVYGGAAEKGVAMEDPRTDNAIATTAGQVRLDASNKVVRTEYSSSTGGWTAPGGLWPAVKDEGDSQSPFHTWTVTLDGAALASKYGVGTFRRVLVIAQNGLGAEGGRVDTVKIVGSTASRTVSGSQFADDWNLNSNWFFPVDQALQQVTWLRYVRQADSRQIYRQFYLASGGWKDSAPISTADWTAKGSLPVTTIAATALT